MLTHVLLVCIVYFRECESSKYRILAPRISRLLHDFAFLISKYFHIVPKLSAKQL